MRKGTHDAQVSKMEIIGNEPVGTGHWDECVYINPTSTYRMYSPLNSVL